MRRLAVQAGLGLLLALSLPGISNAAPILVINPPSQSGNIGDIFTVDVLVTGITDVFQRYDVDVSFATSVLAPLAMTLGTGLGTGGEQVTEANSFSAGVADFAQRSLLGESDLQILQGSAFVLATLTFQGIGTGQSGLTITQAALWGVDGALLSPGPSVQNGGIQVGSSAPVPEPGTLLLLGTGIAALRMRRRRSL